MYFEDGMYREFGRILKQEVDVPIILAGRMDNPELAEESIGTCCDIISYGRPLLADAEIATKIKEGRVEEIRPCLGCHEGCMGRIANATVSCAVNPACGRENIYGLTPALQKKKILVAGGGIAGMETARVCALRGHDVVLCEKSDHLGGNLIPGGVPHFKRYDLKLVDYYKRQMELQGVEVHLNTEVTADTAKSFQADIIVCASGSTPKQMTVNGELPVYTADEVLLGKQDASDQVVIIGGGLVGCETALWLAQRGKKVSVVEILPEILGGHGAMPHMNYYMLTDLLNYHKVDIYTDTKVLKTTSDGVVVETDGTQKVLPAKTVIASIGYKENNMLYEQLKDSEIPVYNIGDSRQVHNIMYAIWNAYELARGL